LEGHEELVRCIRFDGKRIVSGAYDGKIKVWDLKIAMDPRASSSTICIKTLVQHSGRVFRLQFDEFQIVSSSHDDTILIWDFLNTGVDANNLLQHNGAVVGEVDQAQPQNPQPAAAPIGNAAIQAIMPQQNILPLNVNNDADANGMGDDDMDEDIPLHNGNPIAAVLGFENHPPLNIINDQNNDDDAQGQNDDMEEDDDAAAAAIEQQQQPNAEQNHYHNFLKKLFYNLLFFFIFL
jgi:hypothetical protein